MNERRASTAAGYSWRKWEGLRLKQAEPKPSVFNVLLFWLFCLTAGLYGALVVLSLVLT